MRPLKKGTPGKGGGSRPDHFSYTGVGPGLKSSFNAWLAGEPYWCEEAHEHTDRDPGTKPCLNWMTDGALKCPRCRQGKEVRCIGWVPLYREVDGKPVIVIVHENASDLLSALAYPDYVLVGRVDPNSSVFVRKSDNRLSLVSNIESRKHPVNVACDLLTMWKLPELNAWLNREGHWSGVPGDDQPVIRQRLSVPPPTTDVEALAIDSEKKDQGGWDALVSESLKRAKERVKSAETNGKHEPKRE